jgi:hypothetical protein
MFRSREPFAIELHVRPAHKVREPRYAVAVEDYLGRRLFTVASYLSPGSPTPLTGDQVIRCLIPELHLGTGRYQVSVSLSSVEHGMLDSVDGCGSFDVEAHNCYGTGEAYSPAYGPFLETSAWTHL